MREGLIDKTLLPAPETDWIGTDENGKELG